MKICEFTRADLQATMEEYNRRNKGLKFALSPTPMERAAWVLVKALEVVNQAGLDGKRLTDLRVVERYDPGAHFEDQPIEIHAKVTHRLKTPQSS